MGRLSLALISAVSVIAFTHIASAADLPRKAPAYTPPPPPVFSWTGCYVGANIGGGESRTDWIDPPTGHPDGSPRASGFVGGGQLGCDYQVGAWVFGVQGMFDGADWKDTKEELPFFPGFFDEMKNPWFGSVTARLGYTVTPAVLLYVKGGGAWIRNELSVFHEGEFIGDANNTRTGWTIGGGLEWMFAPHWSVFLEYDHMDFGNHDATFTNPDGEHFNVFINNQKADIGLVGVNYRFWSGQPY